MTPNLPEAEALSGLRVSSRGRPPRRRGRSSPTSGARAVLIKGGHGRGDEVRDLFFDGRFFTEFVAPRIRTRATHGTGCTLSSAIAANLALGRTLEDAILAGHPIPAGGPGARRLPGEWLRRAGSLSAEALELTATRGRAT